MPGLNKLAIYPSDVRYFAEPTERLITLDEVKAFVVPGVDTDASMDAQLTEALLGADSWVQGPRSATGVCFTDHTLIGEYASTRYDLYLPGGRVRPSTFPLINLQPVDGVIRAGGGYSYLRVPNPADDPVTVNWISGWGRIPPVVKSVALRVANMLFSVRTGMTEEMDGDVLTEFERLLAPWTLKRYVE